MFLLAVVQGDRFPLNSDKNPTMQSFEENSVLEAFSAPLDSNPFCTEINDKHTTKSALELDIEDFRTFELSDSQNITFDLVPLHDVRVFDLEKTLNDELKNFKISNAEQDITGIRQSTSKPFRYNKRDPRLSKKV